MKIRKGFLTKWNDHLEKWKFFLLTKKDKML